MVNDKQKKITRDRITGLILFLLSIAGLLYIFKADWSRGPGVGAKLFPQISYIVILIIGISLIIERGKGDRPKGALALVSVPSVLLFTGVGALYFFIILKIGLIVATVIYACGVFSLLSINPLRQWKQIILASAIVTLIVWVLFSRLIVLILPTPLLF